MACLNCYLTSLCGWTARIGRMFLVVCLVAVTLGRVPSTLAAPITFGFEAEIHTLFLGFPFESGIDFAAGDPISGRFTFESNEGNGSMSVETIQPFPFVFRVNGVTLATPAFEIRSNNDISISDFPPADVIDSFEIGAVGLSAQDPAIVIAPDQSGFRMTLYGPASAFRMASHPASADDWNRVNLWREVHVTFRDGRGGAIGFQATVGPFKPISESSSLLLTFIAALMVFLAYRRTDLVRFYGLLPNKWLMYCCENLQFLNRPR